MRAPIIRRARPTNLFCNLLFYDAIDAVSGTPCNVLHPQVCEYETSFRHKYFCCGVVASELTFCHNIEGARNASHDKITLVVVSPLSM
ncbi:hypothetical protein HYPSUDRAFT_524599 [Hypholoma sublateritium FD-334 SS-4]|uniref:Uncharacterized protein n=1 Tax=Hypholoma sublateritium (strain FD-334 SS-4) TaxID=945553 RepID=A0A0D2LN50_HYPSF|nr:hypothetical protein HYPSUDRAFT_524599 [Hypholoma sublateritium FD-334 SS-4]